MSPQAMTPCPKCQRSIQATAVECPYCGVIVSKARKRPDESAPRREATDPRPFTVKRDSVTAPIYRVYARPDRIVFAHLGRGSQAWEGVQGGLRAQLGGVGSALVKPAVERAEQRLTEKIRAYDRGGVDLVLRDGGKHLDVAVARVFAASLDATDGFSTVHGKLLLETRDMGKLKFLLPAAEDMQRAIPALRACLGDRLAVRARWDPARGEYFKP